MGVGRCPDELRRQPTDAQPLSQRSTDFMTTPQDAQQFIGRTAVDREGSKIGKIGQVYLAEQTGVPVWLTVTTGMLGTRQNFAPIYGSRFEGDHVRLAVSKDLVKNAPSIDDDRSTEA